MDQTKKFGLIKMNTNKNDKKVINKVLTKSAFFDNSNSDDSDNDNSVFIMPTRGVIKKQDEQKILRAIEEDPNIYEYDEVYDEIKGNDKKNNETNSIQQKSKYIKNMLKTAEGRSKEQELVSERKIQREREKEGDLYKDKETFVTSAYRNKLEEIKKAQVEAEKQERIESMLDVKKQADLGGFYRNLYKHNMAQVRETQGSSSETMEIPKSETITFNKKSQRTQKRQIRNREDDTDDEDDTIIIKKTPDPEPEIVKPSENEIPKENCLETSSSEKKEFVNTAQNKQEKGENKNDTNDDKKEVSDEPEIKIKKPDRMTVIRELFTKRTVGDVFEQALKRYLERKALKCS